MKSEGTELIFRLSGDRTPEEWRAVDAEVARAVGSLVLHTPAFDVAAALGSLAFGRAHMRAEVAGAFAFSAALAIDSIRHMGEQMALAVAEITRPDGPFAQAMRRAEEGREAFGEWFDSLPEEEREEIRRAYEDAPLCPDVDVSAGGVM
jgi:hypothetical protein